MLWHDARQDVQLIRKLVKNSMVRPISDEMSLGSDRRAQERSEQPPRSPSVTTGALPRPPTAAGSGWAHPHIFSVKHAKNRDFRPFLAIFGDFGAILAVFYGFWWFSERFWAFFELGP